jgi:hypothetical protein
MKKNKTFLPATEPDQHPEGRKENSLHSVQAPLLSLPDKSFMQEPVSGNKLLATLV